jgi:acyl-CoA synthetase (AMP-forming)/AMP-acid ligase II
MMTNQAATAGDVGHAEMEQLWASAKTWILPESLGALVDAAAERNGDAPLAKYLEDGTTFSYNAFAEKTRKLASALLAKGIRKGTHVGVMLPNAPSFAITWVALGRIGAVMVPINTAYTQRELHFVLSDSDAQYLVIDQAFLGVWESVGVPLPLIRPEAVVVAGRSNDDGWEALLESGSPDFEPPSAVSRTDLLNLQYTSGTTGFPKACMLSHDYWIVLGSVAAHLRGMDGDVKNILIWAPFFYMDSMWQLLMTMTLGGTAKIAPRPSLTRFYEYLTQEQIHYCIFPETGLAQWPEGEADKAVVLRYVSIFGWSEGARQEFARRFDAVARESFGMTEIGGATIVPRSGGRKTLERTCGMPSAFKELRIVDEHGNDVKDGEIGELWVAGRGILWGYYKRPEANASNFNGRWFRTGDLLTRDSDGYFRIVGRIKDMIRRAGENIAAQEVEACLREMPGVLEVSAIGVPDAKKGEEVKVYLLLEGIKSADDVSPEAVIDFCSSRLAKFKIPRFIEYVKEFPRTASGKILKRELIAEGDLRARAWDRLEARWPSGARVSQ